jgi:23S rRNA-/tRNA-specific pseudouridylate synthase
MAVLQGRLEDDLPPMGTIDLPIGRKSKDDPRRSALPEEEGGQPSQTAYAVVETIPASREKDPGSEHPPQDISQWTFVRVRLLTGRTHQIRVHFAHFGHAVLGDHLYGQPSAFIARQALHASEISFSHPITGQPMRFEAPLPEDIAIFFTPRKR